MIEGIGQLLRGNDFAAKSPDMEIDVVGYHFSEFFEGRTFEERVNAIIAFCETALKSRDSAPDDQPKAGD